MAETRSVWRHRGTDESIRAEEPDLDGETGIDEEPRADSEAGIDQAIEVATKAVSTHPLARGFALGAVVTVAIFIFIVQNRSDVAIEWLWFDFDASMWLVTLVAFLAGGVASPLLWVGAQQIYRRRAQQRADLQRLEESRRVKEPDA